MRLEDLKIGAKVSFHKLKNGKVIGLEDEVLTIIEINHKHWQPCNCKLSNGVFTNHIGIELVETTKESYTRLSIFDFI